jgi:hypothetical protein
MGALTRRRASKDAERSALRDHPHIAPTVAAVSRRVALRFHLSAPSCCTSPKVMDTAVLLSAILAMGAFLVAFLSARFDKLGRRIDILDRKVSLLPEFSEIEKKLKAWQRLALDPSSKLQAIKAYREETGAGLAEAKNAVERWLHMR